MPIFTVSGARGVYGSDVTIEWFLNVASAYASRLPLRAKIAVGRDSRPTGLPIGLAVSSTLASAGCEVFDLGVAATPMIAYIVRAMNFEGAIIVSASHNPPEWNALKFLGERGAPLPPQEVEAIREASISLRSRTVDFLQLGAVYEVDLSDLYLKGLLNLVSRDVLADKKLKVVIDGGGGAGGEIAARALSSAGCKVVSTNCVATGFYPRPLEPTPEALTRFARFVKEEGADVGFAYDCDADRVTVVTDEGEVLREDYSLALAMLPIVAQKKGCTIVVNVATSKLIDDLASEYEARVVRAPVGEANVVQAILRLGAEVGGEGSCGGVVIPRFNLVRDGLASTMKIVELLASTGKPLSALVDELPRYYSARAKVNCPRNVGGRVLEKLQSEAGDVEVDSTDGVKFFLGESWVLVRVSGTEPVVRILAEAKSECEANRLCHTYKRKVASIVEELISDETDFYRRSNYDR